MMIDIATAASRNQKNWKNTKTSWDDLVAKLSVTQRTHETLKEYLAFDKDRQAEIKDVGGFVGGYLIGGRRTPVTNVKHRQLITLDIDFGKQGIWDKFELHYECAGLAYSTHKHTPETPRLRLVMPLSRPVDISEYEALARQIAGKIGIHLFDSTTFQPQRLMYWPSTPKDAEYYFRQQEGEPLDADAALGEYVNWRDMSAWPRSENEIKAVSNLLKKQEDPTEKHGLIGAFCRAYTISAAVDEFLPEVYLPSIMENRYTFADGSTPNGAIVYDDLFLYSHHHTDPAGQKLSNAFDLVRLHKFGDLDKNPDLEVTKQKSYEEMMQMISKLPEVAKENSAYADFEETDWVIKLDTTKWGDPKPTIDNLVLILENDENLKNKFAYNQFEYRNMINGALPWNTGIIKRHFNDNDDAGLRHYLEKTYKIFNANKTRDALDIVLTNNGFHPVRDYFKTLVWDQVPRIEELLIKYFGAEDTRYTRAVTKKSLVAAVARVMVPGIKFDHVLTLVGGQGIGKSSFFRELGGKWFSDSLTSVHGKDAYEQLQGAWIIEMGELASLKKAEVETIKSFIVKTVDRYRVAYGRRVDDFPRQCVFYGTTNEKGFLKDATGNRRFWPVEVTKKYKLGQMNVDQIWAEAQELFYNRESLYLNEALEAEAGVMQLNHSETDDRTGMITAFMEVGLPDKWSVMDISERRRWIGGDMDELTASPGIIERQMICAAEVWCELLGGERKDMTNHNTKFIHNALSNTPGWERSINKQFPIYGYQRAYVRSKVKQPTIYADL